MSLTLLIACLFLLAVAGVLMVLLGRFGRARKGGARPALARISAERYRPMARLLDPADEEFLARCQERSAIRRFRSQRRRIFRGYLRSLERDFGAICASIRLILAHSEMDRPDLASALMRRETGFAMALFSVRCRLLLHAAGVGAVDVHGLVAALDEMRGELGKLTPAASAAAA
jgi:hypothetical protein